MIHSDGRGVVSELAFSRGGSIPPHDNPNTAWFIVIEGGGWVLVGEERRRVAAGEAVLWPANVEHGAWTDHGEMRAFVVEFAGEDDRVISGLLGGPARQLGPGEAGQVERGEGRLAERRPALDPNRDSEGEPV